MYKIDCHLHTSFSADSNLLLSELIEKAIELNYKIVTITEHLDLLPSELAVYGCLSLHKYFDAILHLQNKYPQITIFKGIELGEAHRVVDCTKEIFRNYQPDMILGSLHLLRNNKNVSTLYDFPLQEKDISLYFEENLEIVEEADINILGHLCIYKRNMGLEYYFDETKYYPIIDKIFDTLIQREIALEVNISGLRRKLCNTIPDYMLLTRYLKKGGKLLSIGSDTHHLDDFDIHYNRAIDSLITLGFHELFYFNKEWISIPISEVL